MERGNREQARVHEIHHRLASLGRVGSLYLLITFLLASCSAEMYRKRADREVYTDLFSRTTVVENVAPKDIELTTEPPVSLSELKTHVKSSEALGDFARYEKGAKVLPFPQALEMSITHGRDYLRAKEELYLASLDLSLARHRLTPIFFAQGLGTRASDSRNATLLPGMTKIVATDTFARSQSAGFSWLMATGARLSTDFTQDFLRIMTGNRSINESDLAVSLVQPLLQGAGTLVTLEALTQEERNLLYTLRDFADFRREYIVNVANSYYGVLRSRNQVYNNFIAYQGYVKNVEREEGFAEVGKRTQNQLGRLKQAKLIAENRWIDAARSYLSKLDEFKIQIGIPVSENVVLDDNELKKLQINAPGITREEAVKIALVTRPDLATAKDRVDDAERHIKVAKNGLLPGLNVAVEYNPVSSPGDTTPGINWNRRRWASRLDLDLPLDRKAERNIYRSSFIARDRSIRAEQLARDRAQLEIFDAWRSLDQEKASHRIAEEGVSLAARRLEEQQLRSELGQGEAKDLVDAQEDLVDAQNLLTGALIDYTMARLRLWRDMGILYIQSDGSWVERLQKEKPYIPEKSFSSSKVRRARKPSKAESRSTNEPTVAKVSE